MQKKQQKEAHEATATAKKTIERLEIQQLKSSINLYMEASQWDAALIALERLIKYEPNKTPYNYKLCLCFKKN